jgi:hypothetical protein
MVILVWLNCYIIIGRIVIILNIFTRIKVIGTN